MQLCQQHRVLSGNNDNDGDDDSHGDVGDDVGDDDDEDEDDGRMNFLIFLSDGRWSCLSASPLDFERRGGENFKPIGSSAPQVFEKFEFIFLSSIKVKALGP